MNICSVCQQETISEPYDTSKPIVCEECKRKCTTCGELRVGGHPCAKCNKPEPILKSNFGIIDKTTVAGLSVSSNHYKHMNTRVSTPEGETLSGQAGLNYMKSQGDTYASRLKEYYK